MFLAASFTAYLAVLFARSTGSFTRFPADPGYLYIQEAADKGFASLTFGDPYFHIAARALAWLTSFAPLAWHAVVLSTLVHLVWAACAVCVAYVVSLESLPKWIAALAGLLLVSAPHASESSIGNIGNIKWPLLAAAIVICSSAHITTFRQIRVIGLLTVTGLTQPIAILCLFPLLYLGIKESGARRALFPLAFSLLATSALQIVKVGLPAATTGRSEKITEPWDGMGVFWWSGLLGPIVLGISVFVLLQTLPSGSLRQTSTNLSVLSVVLTSVSYLMGGIADRYFVGPLTLACIGGLLALSGLGFISNRSRSVVVMLAISLLMIPTGKWFFASHYLTSGPKWSTEVQEARELCKQVPQSVVRLEVAGGSTVELDCEYVLRG